VTDRQTDAQTRFNGKDRVMQSVARVKSVKIMHLCLHMQQNNPLDSKYLGTWGSNTSTIIEYMTDKN